MADTDAFSSNKESDKISNESDSESYYNVKKFHTHLSVDIHKNKYIL